MSSKKYILCEGITNALKCQLTYDVICCTYNNHSRDIHYSCIPVGLILNKAVPPIASNMLLKARQTVLLK
jgi:hypothetical protein